MRKFLIFILDSLEKMFEFKAEYKGLELTFERESGIPEWIKTDEKKLRQVLINLIGNGIKFTEEGSVKVNVMAIGYMEDGGMRSNSSITQILFSIKDTGDGITPNELDKLFKPFSQTLTGYKPPEGTGLGLVISQKFVQLMNGEIRVNSVVGEGSELSFDILVEIIKTYQTRKNQPLEQKLLA